MTKAANVLLTVIIKFKTSVVHNKPIMSCRDKKQVNTFLLIEKNIVTRRIDKRQD